MINRARCPRHWNRPRLSSKKEGRLPSRDIIKVHKRSILLTRPKFYSPRHLTGLLITATLSPPQADPHKDQTWPTISRCRGARAHPDDNIQTRNITHTSCRRAFHQMWKVREDFSILLPRRRPQERLGMARDLKDTGGKKTMFVLLERERRRERGGGDENSWSYRTAFKKTSSSPPWLWWSMLGAWSVGGRNLKARRAWVSCHVTRVTVASTHRHTPGKDGEGEGNGGCVSPCSLFRLLHP